MASLLVSAIAIAGVSASLAHGDEPSEDVLASRAADLLSRAIRIPTVNPPGNEAALAELFVRELRSLGLESRRIDTPTADGVPARAAVWARLPGSGARRPLILLSHLDVVAAEEDGWPFDPFAGEQRDGQVHGRGALDAKGVGVIQLLALAELARRARPLDRDVILLATPDEELGGRDGAGFVVSQHRELLGGAEYLITEGGSIRPGSPGMADASPAPSVWGVAVSEKSPCWLELTAHGPPGHASAPATDAAVPRLIAALDRVRRAESAIRVLSEVEAMFLAMAPAAEPEDRAGYATLTTALEEDSGFRRRFLANPHQSALIRNTVALTWLEGSATTNVVPARARARLDARLLPGERCEDFVKEIRAVIADPGIEIATLLAFTSRSSPVETDLFRAIQRVAAEIEPGALVVPRLIPGFTDAHWFRDQGIVSYGFVPRWLSANDSSGVHGPAERISVDNLVAGIHTLVRIIEELAALP